MTQVVDQSQELAQELMVVLHPDQKWSGLYGPSCPINSFMVNIVHSPINSLL